MLDELRRWPEWIQHDWGRYVDRAETWLLDNVQWLFDLFQAGFLAILTPVEDWLLWLPWPVIVGALALLGLVLAGWRMAAGITAALVFIGSMGLWGPAMATLALVLVSTLIAVVLGVPLGIAMARSEIANAAIRPLLDFLQTIPSFVYLIPAVLLLGIGRVSAALAIILYAIPPVIRLTNLGIRSVPEETVEAGIAYGATPWQLLRKVQLPLGFPTLMAGVNQTIMMALAMVIVASLIGAGGLGDEVLRGLNRLETGTAFTAGFAIVLLAIIIDRLSEAGASLRQRRRSGGGAADERVDRPGGEAQGDAQGEDAGEDAASEATGATRSNGQAQAPAQAPAPHDREGPDVVLRGLTKVFGPDPAQAQRLQASGATKAEILERAGATIAVDDVSLEVQPGETFIVMGLSGSGKSTLVRCLNRLIEPTSGTIEITGDDVTEMDASQLIELRRRRLGMVFQRFALLPHRNVLDNVAFGLELQGVDREERERSARSVLDVVGLAGWETSHPDQLSGGMQQRVGLARALAHDPDILLMDEPFSALDPLMRRQLQHELRDLQQRLRKTIVFITHDLDEALALGDRIAIMKDGRVEQIGAPDEILLHPASDYVASFVEGTDKTAVLTAADVMFRRVTTATLDQSPRVALHQMERLGLSSLFVTDADRRLQGLVTADAAVDAVQEGCADLRSAVLRQPATTSPEDPVQDLMSIAAWEPYPIAVIDERQRLRGYVARVSILRGLVGGDVEPPTVAGEPAADATIGAPSP